MDPEKTVKIGGNGLIPENVGYELAAVQFSITAPQPACAGLSSSSAMEVPPPHFAASSERMTIFFLTMLCAVLYSISPFVFVLCGVCCNFSAWEVL